MDRKLQDDRNGSSIQRKKISIVGAGLVGSLAALHLARKGHEIHLYEYREDIRKAQLVAGRSINLALSARGRKALAEVGLEETMLEHGIPMKGRMLHDLKGNRTVVPYDRNTNQCIYSIGRKYLNEVLLNESKKYENIHLHFNQKLVSGRLEAGRLSFQDTTTRQVKDETTDLTIGCDGAFSAVRRQMLSQPGFNFSQTYIEHGYIELCIPATESGEFAMPHNYLHIWPRGKFMMIALPNQDKSWTVTLFMPFENFERLDSIDRLMEFFTEYFPDSIPLIGEKKLMTDFFNATPQALVSVKCRKYHISSKVLLMGDAAHAMVPFYGQGMNAGFEDCTLLSNILSKHEEDIESALEAFTESRWENAQSICDLAMYNYVEMRDLVNRKSFRFRKLLDDFLFNLFPNSWIPLYNSVSFSHMPYKQCIANRAWQDKILNRAINCLTIFTIAGFSFGAYKTFEARSSLIEYFTKLPQIN